MRTTVALIVGCVLGGSMSLVGCGPHAPAPAPAATPLASHEKAAPEIVRLVGRHFTVTIVAGPKAPLYTVVSDSGDVLAERMTLAELRENKPDVYRNLAPALAPSLRADAHDVPEGPIMLDPRLD
jgi:hypothetical protein